MVLTHGIPPASRGGVIVHLFVPPTAIGSVPIRVYQVMQLRTDGIQCREFAGTQPVVLKVVPVTGATFSGTTIDQLMCASLFPDPILILYVVCSGHDDMCDTVRKYSRLKSNTYVGVFIEVFCF